MTVWRVGDLASFWLHHRREEAVGRIVNFIVLDDSLTIAEIEVPFGDNIETWCVNVENLTRDGLE